MSSKAKRTYREIFVDTLATLAKKGASPFVSNQALRTELDWEEDKYDRIKRQLKEEGEIVVGRGYGGSVSLGGPSQSKALKIFISYSHVDTQMKEHLVQHLKPLARLKLGQL